jgi:hypothetical protein
MAPAGGSGAGGSSASPGFAAAAGCGSAGGGTGERVEARGADAPGFFDWISAMPLSLTSTCSRQGGTGAS